MPAEVTVLQHVECETIGSIAESLEARKLSARTVRLFQGEPVPSSLGFLSGLIVMDGPMDVYAHEQFPFLTDEMRLLETTVRGNRLAFSLASAAGSRRAGGGQFLSRSPSWLAFDRSVRREIGSARSGGSCPISFVRAPKIK
jgi:hypothetical protein